MTVHRLRPTVFATPISTGVHVRGWASSFTIEGGAGLWRVWSALAGQLAAGVPGDQLAAPAGLPPEVRRAIEGFLDQLHAHDLLVEVPQGWGESGVAELPPSGVARWLEAVAASPASTWSRLRDVTVEVRGAGPVADAARRALRDAGVRCGDEPSGHVEPAGHAEPSGHAEPAGRDAVGQAVELRTVALFARDRQGRVVAATGAGCGDEVAFVTPVSTAGRLPAVVAELAGRLRAVPAADPPVPLAALVGGAAVHRLLASVGGLLDPAEEIKIADGPPPEEPAGPVHPAVLVARMDPLRASYHPWLGDAGAAPTGVRDRARREPADAGPAAALPAAALPAAAVDLAVALRRLDVLCDPELGLLPPPEPADLPQVPAALAIADKVLGIGATADAARLDAGLRAAERLAGDGWVVGVDARHAAGVALRRAVHAARNSLPGADVPESSWADSPAARRWWKALTLRFGIDARVRVRRLAPTAMHAEIIAGGTVLAWAVEATAADAVGLAALAATGVAQARAAGVAVTTGGITLNGAAPGWLPPEPDTGGRSTPNWHWPAGIAEAEEKLQRALEPLVGPPPEQPLTAMVDPGVLRAGFALTRLPTIVGAHPQRVAEVVEVRS
ncbi:hypothetical protein BDK92_6424 [Micromonospora pisi]|uniref:YcaO domain-containing protein n=1 Tax=Micromonospora pisi TaxID=589240 RepID=A0A495JSP6_9ACTN|nr:hypothetical protein [Micromonospora pisi]RKR91993.1 hypothetical protein BDK92_6424 [Micromonospora pisi]